MTLDELKKAFQAVRALTVEDGGASFSLAVPTALEMLRISHAADLDADNNGLFNYRLVRERLTGWSGVDAADVVPGAEGGLGFSPAAVELYLATRPALVGKLADAMMDKFAELQEAQEAARKN